MSLSGKRWGGDITRALRLFSCMRDGRAFSNKLVPVLTSGKKLAQKSCAFFLHYLGFRCFLKHLQFREGDVMCSNNFHRMQRK